MRLVGGLSFFYLMLTSFYSILHVFTHRFTKGSTPVLTFFNTFASHRSKLPSNWNKNKVKKSWTSIEKNMENPEIEKNLLPFRVAVKEQVNNIFVFIFFLALHSYCISWFKSRHWIVCNQNLRHLIAVKHR